MNSRTKLYLCIVIVQFCIVLRRLSVKNGLLAMIFYCVSIWSFAFLQQTQNIFRSKSICHEHPVVKWWVINTIKIIGLHNVTCSSKPLPCQKGQNWVLLTILNARIVTLFSTCYNCFTHCSLTINRLISLESKFIWLLLVCGSVILTSTLICENRWHIMLHKCN